MIPHLLRCQGFAVVYYGFALGRLESGAPLQRRIFDLDYRSIRVIASIMHKRVSKEAAENHRFKRRIDKVKKRILKM